MQLKVDRRNFLSLAIAAVLVPSVGLEARASEKTAYDFAFDRLEGGPMPLSQWRGKALLVVNTASLCGFTPQYAALERVWTRYRDRGLVVVGVPSNDFGGQEPGKAGEIKEFCETTFGIDFPLAAKSEVVGTGAHPFYRWAADVLGAGRAPQWNFHKYLVGRDGRLINAFPSATAPDSMTMTQAIEAALSAKTS
jgi:glutathione peroxidase